MKKFLICVLVLLTALGLFSCKSELGGTQNGESGQTELTYSESWSYNKSTHWHACTTKGYTGLKADEGEHIDGNERIIRSATETEAGLAQYTCTVCGYSYQKPIYVSTSIISLPSVGVAYIGQPLSGVELIGGIGSVEGEFTWTSPDTIIEAGGEYSVTFKPSNHSTYATIEAMVMVEAQQLTITVSSGEGGSASNEGVINVKYGEDLEISFTPDEGFMVDSIIVDGKISSGSKYIFTNIKESHTLSVAFKVAGSEPYTIVCESGTPSCYTISDGVISFNTISEDSVYSIQGSFEGGIVINVGEEFNFELVLLGFSLTSNSKCPITVLSAKNVDIKAKADTENFIYDEREAVDEADATQYSASIYSLADLDICGQGKLSIISKSNNGIHTKDDLVVKNLTLYIKCVDNALKGNDSVTITNADTTLIASAGDCIKTTNSDISTTNSKQRGIISISGGSHKLYAGCDGIDASYDVIIDNETTSLEIYTDKYSSYSSEVTTTTEAFYYVRMSSSSYSFSLKYVNNDGSYVWENATYHTSVQSGRSTYYYYSVPKRSDYTNFVLYIYSSSQAQGQDSSYYSCSEALSHNDSYDTIAISNRQGSLSLSWTTFSTTSTQPGGGMNEGNTDKGTYSTKGIKACNQIIIDNGSIKIEAYDDAIHANNDVALESGATPLGNVTINGGSLVVSSNDDGLHADGTLAIVNGSVTVAKSYEGLEGAFVSVSGGSVSVTSTDDGINGGSTSGASITISGGEVYVYCTGDGIDSNSTTSNGGIVFSGGKTVVICNSNGNSAIDSERGFSHTGGQVIAIMSSGGMTSESSNGSSTGMTTKSSLSLTSGGFATVSVGGSVVVTIKMPCSLSAYAVYLGSSSATISSTSSSTATLNSNGVCWE